MLGSGWERREVGFISPKTGPARFEWVCGSRRSRAGLGSAVEILQQVLWKLLWRFYSRCCGDSTAGAVEILQQVLWNLLWKNVYSS
jgi:hypothetical protein